MEFLTGWLIYPFSEIVHALQGVLAGWLGSRAIIKKEPSDAICAFMVTVAFAIYEITEQWSVGDEAFADFENFWIVCVATGLLYGLYHLWRKYKRGSH